jgi:hypothetical protein
VVEKVEMMVGDGTEWVTVIAIQWVDQQGVTILEVMTQDRSFLLMALTKLHIKELWTAFNINNFKIYKFIDFQGLFPNCNLYTDMTTNNSDFQMQN